MTSEQPVAIVTGGAQGIGLAAAKCLSQHGFHIAVADLRPEVASAAASDLIESGGQASAYAVDVADTESVNALMAQVEADLGRLDTLVTSAGITDQQASAVTTDESWSRMLGVHLDGTFRCCRAAYPLLRQAPSPSIVTISSVVAGMGLPGRLSYAVAKCGVEGLTRTLAVEWAPDGIRVNAVAPGWTRTVQFAHASKEGIVDEARLTARIPMGRVAEPEEIGKAIAFLASSDASYISGQTLVVDGCASIGFST